MTILKPLLSLIFAFFCLSVFGQSNSNILLKWKLKPGETIIYKTAMTETDTANHKDVDMTGMMKAVNKAADLQDTGSVAQMGKMMKELNKELENTGLISKLSQKRKGVVDIDILTVDNDSAPQTKQQQTNDSLKNVTDLFRKMMKAGIAAHGAVYDNGGIESFYLPNNQRNLISLFFELPRIPVKVGESWSLDTHLISLDQNFRSDTSYLRNNVTLASVNLINNEHIADIEYDFVEYTDGNFKSPFSGESIKTMMKMTYRASAKFSIERGRWIFYDGLMSISSTGMMSMQSTKKFSLVLQ